MAFYGSSFIFDGKSCEDFDLMMYAFNDDGLSEDNEVVSVSIVDEVVGNRWRPYFYGVSRENKLAFEIVFGVNQDRIDKEEHLTRPEIAEISAWIAGHRQYKWLEIEQEDMSYLRYRCIITNLSVVEYGQVPWAFKALVSCDSEFAYTYPREYSYDIDGVHTIKLANESSMDDYYYPVVIYTPINGGDFEIVNETDNGRVFRFTDIPSSIETLTVDNENGIISSNLDINMYPCFNFKFFRLKRGQNTLRVTGQ